MWKCSVNYKTLLINIQSCRNERINAWDFCMGAVPNCVSSGTAFMINAPACWGDGGGQTQKSDLNSSLRFAACWSHCLRHTPKSVTSASVSENESTYPISGSPQIWAGITVVRQAAWQNKENLDLGSWISIQALSFVTQPCFKWPLSGECGKHVFQCYKDSGQDLHESMS